MATPLADSVTLSGDPYVNGLVQGGSWQFSGAHELTYSLYSDVVGTTWTAARVTAIQSALASWSAVANIQFIQLLDPVGNARDSSADMAIVLSGALGDDIAGIGIFPDPEFADAILPGYGYTPLNYANPEGDLYLNASYLSTLSPGGDDYNTMVHELGHALGLKHPHDYGGNGWPLLPAVYDSSEYTVMSYNHIDGWTLASGNAASPMLMDILAIQYIYGANTSYHTGDDVYLLANDGAAKTIWDAGGVDTFSAAGNSAGVLIDLAEAGFSYHGASGAMTAIAYGVVIEKAVGSSYADDIYGNGIANVIDGGAGADYMSGGLGDDVYYADNYSDFCNETAGQGIDTVYASASFLLDPEVENLILTGVASISGTGSDIANDITGNAGSNTLDGGLGADTLRGGLGSDTYVLNEAGDVIVEMPNSGTDTVRAGFSYTLQADLENLELLGVGNFTATGNGLDNRLLGNSGHNTLDGGAGYDDLRGGAGNDTYIVDNQFDFVFEFSGEGVDTVQSSANNYRLGLYVENLVLTGSGNLAGKGNSSANRIDGNAGNNTLDGASGGDTLLGGAGDDTYYRYSLSDSIVENVGGGTDTVQTLVSCTLGDYLENLTLLTGVLSGTGNSLDNLLQGNASDNSLDGGSGADTLVGGAGNDTYYVDNASDQVTESDGQGTDTVRASFDYTLGANIENLVLLGSAASGTGNALNNLLTGNSGNNTLDGGTGMDTLVGGAGDDLYLLDSTLDVLTEISGDGTDTVHIAATYTLGANLENLLLLGSTNINGTGNALNNQITGNDGSNTLDGSGGIDTLVGGLGDDAYLVESTGDVITENAGEGTDSVIASASYTLSAHVEFLALGGSGNLNGTGNASNNRITGNAGNNVLDGASGADTLVGGTGNDTYLIDDAGDLVTELLNEGADLVRSQVDHTLAANLESLILLGAAISGAGNTLANQITGNAGNNLLTGLDGNDTLIGGAGDDTLIGGIGDDTYTMDDLGDLITENAGEGIDTLYISIHNTGAPVILSALANIENILFTADALGVALATNGSGAIQGGSGSNDSIAFTGGGSYTLPAGVENLLLTQSTGNIGGTGGAENNLLEGNSGANLLDGGAGNDTLKGYAGEDILLGGSGNDLLNGGKGADRLEGGLGDDTYVIDNSGDQIIEALGAGTDTVRSSLRSTTLGDNLENLVLEGTAKANGIGNALNNQLTGNNKANILTGGAGTDTFIFNTSLGPLNVDTLTDFTGGQDKIALDDSIFTTLSGASSIWYHSVTSLAQTDADDRIVYNASTGALYYDADGAGGAAAIRFAMLSGAPTVGATDFQVI